MLRKKINSHKLLQGASPTLSYEVLRRVRTQANELLAGSDPQTSTFLRNLCALSHKEIFDLYALYGEEGLFNLSLLMYSEDFDWFYPLIVFDLKSESRTEETYLSLDNAAISVHPKVKTFQTNVFRPALARKIFRPGTHHGFICYGLAGPRILVSHPFQGNAKEIETYDIYRNSADVVLRLMERGYRGTFLFLDYLAGLNEEIEGVPAWSLWFSFLATQADLVVYKGVRGRFRVCAAIGTGLCFGLYAKENRRNSFYCSYLGEKRSYAGERDYLYWGKRPSHERGILCVRSVFC